MLESITINGKQVPLKASLFANLIYKESFGRELLADVLELQERGQALQGAENPDKQELTTYGEIRDIYYRLLWAFAYAADRATKPFRDWLYDIEEIDFQEVTTKVNVLAGAAITIDRKNV